MAKTKSVLAKRLAYAEYQLRESQRQLHNYRTVHHIWQGPEIDAFLQVASHWEKAIEKLSVMNPDSLEALGG